MPGAKPYGQLQYKEVNGKRMAYIDEGEGDAIVFQHGNPSSSYLWRNVMPHVEGLGRLVACDLIGMGGSEKLDNSGPDSYHYRENRDYLFSLWDALDLGDRVTLVLHDWGGALGFDWARQNSDRVVGIAHMETVAVPMEWTDLPDEVAEMFRGLRSAQGEALVLEDNVFVEGVLPSIVLRTLTDEEMDHYRRPFLNAGEDRRPTLSWPRDVPLAGEPEEVVAIVEKIRSMAGRERRAQIIRPRRTRRHSAAGTRPRHRAQLAQPDRGHCAGYTLPSGGQRGRDWSGHRVVHSCDPAGGTLDTSL